MPLKVSLRLVQLGAIAVVLAASTATAFDLDRFLVPKELVLHLTAVLAGLFALRRLTLTRVDRALLAFLALGAVSILVAENPWLGFRALALSASALLLFLVARALRDAGHGRSLLNVLAFAVVLASVSSLLQAYGLWLDIFTGNRSPGGTLGNRNFVAHAAAFGFPLVLLAAFRAKKGMPFIVASCGATLVTASLVLTRSRAAWLAFGAMAAMFLLMTVAAPQLRRDGRTWRRLIELAVFIGLGVAAALLIPNALRWRSDNPYLDSVRDVANYQEGSGRGRLIQYERTLRMAASSPVFALIGAGPGNWPVAYPAHAPAGDPSLDTSEGGMTFNPWPSSDWVAFASERGFPAVALMLLVFAAIALGALRRVRSAADPDDAYVATACLATVVAAGVVGAFDAVLLLGLPAFLVWTALGAMHGEALPVPLVGVDGPVAPRFPWVVLLVLAVSLGGAMRSAAQLAALELYAEDPRLASRIDPANYRLHLRLAGRGKRQQRCEHALAAHALYPTSHAARAASRGCGDQ